MDFSLAQLINVIVLLSSRGGNGGGGTSINKYGTIGIHAGILFLHALINSLPISYLSLFGQVAAAWNVAGANYNVFSSSFLLVFSLLFEAFCILDFLLLLEY